MKVLIADDELTSREILQATMALWGYKPIVVEDGLQALEIMSQPDPPSLLMLDWEMPGLDGLSLCHHLTLNLHDNPPYIIMLTARNETNDVISGLAAGANDFVTKPFHPEILRARVNVARRMLELQGRLTSTLKKLDVLAHIDELTELKNRRAANQAIESELERAYRQKSSLCVGLCDIDFFKQVNDTYGHAAGDSVLKKMAELLRKNLRSYDVIGRFGGEEFIFALIAGKTEATVILERTRLDIEQASFPFRDVLLKLTMSFGAIMVDTGQTVPDLNRVLEQADNALYHSKQSGRNQLTMLSEDMTASVQKKL